MNDITKDILQKVISSRKYELESLDEHIDSLERSLKKQNDKKVNLIEEIEILEKDLNK